MAEPLHNHHTSRTGTLTSPSNRLSTRRKAKKNNLPVVMRPVRNLPGTQRVAVVIPIRSSTNQTSKKHPELSSSSSLPKLAMLSRKRNCSNSLGHLDTDQQPEIVPRLRKKTRQTGPLTPAPTSPIHSPRAEDVVTSEDEILLRPSTHSKSHSSKNKPLQLPSPTSSHAEHPVRSRADTAKQVDVVTSELPSTPLKPKSKKIISQTAPVNRVLPGTAAADQSLKRTRGRPRQRPLSPSPSSHRSPSNPFSNTGPCDPKSDDDDADVHATLELGSPIKGRLFQTRVESQSRTPIRRSSPRPDPLAADSTRVPSATGPLPQSRRGQAARTLSDCEPNEEILRQIENMIPCDNSLVVEKQGSLRLNRRIPGAPVETTEDDLVSGVDERCFKALQDVKLPERSDQSDDEATQDSDADEARVAAELSRHLPSSSNRSPRRLSSVSPLEISTVTTTRLRRLTRHAQDPTTRASQKQPAPKAVPQTDAAPVKIVVDKDAFTSSTVAPYLHNLLQHLSGVRPLPIRIPEAFAVSPSDPPNNILAILDQTPCLVGLEDLEIELRSILFRSVSQQEGNVLLLAGARGSGKTAVISRSLALLSDPLTCGPDSFITIRLNGLVHNSDKVALKEMCRQLFSSLSSSQNSEQRRRLDQVNQDLDFRADDSGDEYEYEDEDDHFREAAPTDQPKFTNYGETLKNLLDVLEPSSSLCSEPDSKHQRKKANNSKALVIVLEEFDLFSDLDRQSFLYCLLDSVQGNKRQNGICVIGTTSVVDCLDKLEKRVKSRCQSRIRYLHSPRTEPERIELLRSLLQLHADHHSPAVDHNQKRRPFVEQWNELLESFLNNAHTREWLRSKFMLINDPLVQILQDLNGMVSMIAYQVKRTGQLKLPVLNPSELFPTRSSTVGPVEGRPMVKRSGTQATTTSMPWWASALSIAEFSVLIACKHLTSSHHNGIFNLEMAWDSYRQHLKRLSLATDTDPLQNLPRSGVQLRPAAVRSQVYGRDAFELAWERLQRLELILPIEMLNSRAAAQGKKKKNQSAAILGKRYELVKLVPFLSQIDSVLLGSSCGPSSSSSLARVPLAHHLIKWAKNSSD
ncbi:hypothetical protein VP01_87g8 [Puccinia sorghi]|uniref:Uncharacterized protein n=1 Tax=Puccinia sorghi TaxID=27349 RepID=A0A0L6UAJ2_9BASI|nr:hypothetical protein VP01_87g8 [Puccinia sorghi]